MHKCRRSVHVRPSVPGVEAADLEEYALTPGFQEAKVQLNSFSRRISTKSDQIHFYIHMCTHQDSLCCRCQTNIMPRCGQLGRELKRSWSYILPRIRLFSIRTHWQKPLIPFISLVTPGSCCLLSSSSMLTHYSACCRVERCIESETKSSA